jgi:hypothetical protein
VTTEYQSTRRELAERYFNCESCGARGEVIFHAVGKSAWVREGFFQENAILKAQEQAEGELFKDAARTLDLVKCPTCGRRARGAMMWVCLRVGVWSLLAIGYGLFGGRDPYAYLIAALPIVVFAWLEASRLRRASKAVITKLQPGTIPAREPPKPKPKPRVPPARAVAAPRPAPQPQAALPVLQPSPRPPSPIEPGAEPTILRHRDGES